MPLELHPQLTLAYSRHKQFSDCLCGRPGGRCLFSMWDKGQPPLTYHKQNKTNKQKTKKTLIQKNRATETSPRILRILWPSRRCAPSCSNLLVSSFSSMKKKKIIWLLLWEDFQVLLFKEQLKVNCGQYLKRVLYFCSY